MIHARVYGGFGNRLPAMASVMVLSKQYGVEYKIYWSDDGAGSYTHILNDSNIVDCKNVDWKNVEVKLINNELTNVNGEIFLSICNPIKCDKNLLKQMIKNFNYNSDIVVDKQFTNYVGLHLRCNHPIIDVNKFLTLLYKFLDVHPTENYFLCADDVAIKNKVLEDFKHIKIFSYDNYCKRDYSERSDKHALLDLLTLCNCKEVVGSISSTFTHFARYFDKKIIHLDRK